MSNGHQKRTIEIRAGEGGDDARLFARELAASYEKACAGLG